MNASRELSEKVEATLRDFVANSEPKLISFDEPLDLRKIANELNALPMFLDLGGCYCLRPNGEIFSFLWDEPDKFDVEVDPRIQNLVLFQGAKKYPELKELVPLRSPDAVECSHCEGTGEVKGLKEHGLSSEAIVCYCGGLGWLSANEK